MDIYQHTHPQKFCGVFPPGLASQVNLIALVSTDAWLSMMSAWVAFTEPTWGFETHPKISELCVEQEKAHGLTTLNRFHGLCWAVYKELISNNHLWTWSDFRVLPSNRTRQDGSICAFLGLFICCHVWVWLLTIWSFVCCLLAFWYGYLDPFLTHTHTHRLFWW